MPKFFLPPTTNTKTAETAYAQIRKFVEGQASGPLDARRIFRMIIGTKAGRPMRK